MDSIQKWNLFEYNEFACKEDLSKHGSIRWFCFFFFRYIIFLSFKKHMDYYYYFFIYLLKCPFNLFRLLFIPKSREIECASKWINKICENGMGFHQAFHSFFSLHSKQRSLYVTLKKNRKIEKAKKEMWIQWIKSDMGKVQMIWIALCVLIIWVEDKMQAFA